MLEDVLTLLDRAWEAVPHLTGPRQPASDRLRVLLNEQRGARRPAEVLLADNLGSTLRDELLDLRRLPDVDYYDLVEDILEGLLSCFDRVHQVSEHQVAYLKDIERVWIACEPCLELLRQEMGPYGLLKKQLKVCKEVVFFQTTDSYFNAIRRALKEDATFHDNLLERMKLAVMEEPLQTPAVLYISSSTRNRAFQGAAHPMIAENPAGTFGLQKKLSPDWMTDIAPGEAKKLKKKLHVILKGQ